MTEDIKEYIRSCEACQKTDPLMPAKKPELQQIKVSRPFELVGVDLVGPLRETPNGNKYIFTATDYFTKWVEAFPLKTKKADEVAKCFEKVFARHGVVNATLADQGRELINAINHTFCEDWGIKHQVAAAYHPQTHGLYERTNQTLKITLRKLVNEHHSAWDDFIDAALFSQRSKPHSSTKYSPFFLLYGREALFPSQLPSHFSEDSKAEEPSAEEIKTFTQKRVEDSVKLTNTVNSNIEIARQKQQKDFKRRGKKKRKYIECNAGDKVLVHKDRKASTKQKGNISNNFAGPYTIISVEGKVATLRDMYNE